MFCTPFTHNLHSAHSNTNLLWVNLSVMVFRGGMVKTSALYTKGRRFEPHRRRFFTPTVVLLSFKKPETVLWTIAKILLLYYSFKIGRPLYCKRTHDEFEDILTGLSIGSRPDWKGHHLIRWSDITFYLSTVSQRPWILENLNTNEEPGSAGAARESNSTRPTLTIFNHLVLVPIFLLAFMI